MILLVQCKPTSKIVKIDTLQPSESELPPYIRNFGFVNLVCNDFANIDTCEKSENLSFYKLISKDVFNGVSNIIEETPIFDTIKIISTKLNLECNNCDWVEIENICLVNDIDALIVLVSLDTSISFSAFDYSNTSYLDDYFDNVYPVYAFLQTKVYASFKIFNPYMREITNNEFFGEKLEWESKGNFLEHSIYLLPDTATALQTTAYFLGENYVKKFAPYWDSDFRTMYYAKNKVFIDAVKFADSNKWDEALIEWQKIVNYPNKKVAKYARFNLALAHEIQGDIDSSEYWINNTLEEFKFPDAEAYLKIIKERKKEIEALNSQIY